MCPRTLMVVPAVLRSLMALGLKKKKKKTAEKFMTSLQSSEGLGEAMRLAPRLPGLCLKLQLRQGHADVRRNVYRPWTLGDGMF